MQRDGSIGRSRGDQEVSSATRVHKSLGRSKKKRGEEKKDLLVQHIHIGQSVPSRCERRKEKGEGN